MSTPADHPVVELESRRYVLMIVAFLSGAVLMSLEILGFRVIDRTFGSALRETSVVISVFLGAMSLGYWLGGRSGDRNPRPASLAGPFLVAALTIALVPTINQTIADRVFHSSLPRGLHSLIVTTVLFAIPAGMLSSIYPVVVRVLVRDKAHTGSITGSISAISTAGSIVGSLVTAFWLIDLFRSVDLTIRWLAVTTLILAVTSVLIDDELDESSLTGRLRRSRVAMSILVIAVLGGAGTLALRHAMAPPDLERILGPEDYGARVLLARDSPYHQVTVRDFNRRRTLYFGRTVQTFRDLDDPTARGARYTDFFHAPMLMDPEIRSVLFIGLGGGTGPIQFLQDYPSISIDAVEVDPVVVEAANEFFGVVENERFDIHTEDARAFLKRADETWDLIVIDAYTTNRYGATIPAHLTTAEFFELCSDRLSEDGMLLFHVMAPREFEISRAIAKTLYLSFPHQMVFGGTEILAMKTEPDLDPSHRGEALQERAGNVLPHRPWLVDLMDEIAPGRLKIEGLPVLTDDYAPVDTLIRKDGGI